MSSPTLLRRLLIGRRAFILSHVEFKKIILTGQLSLVVVVISTCYAFYDISRDIYTSWPYQAACGILALACFFLNRNGWHTLSKVLLAITSNITIFIFVTSEDVATELNIFFIVIAIATMAGFGYEQRYLALCLFILTLLLYLATVLTDFKIITEVNRDVVYLKENRMINFITALVAATLIVFALISVNFHSEKALRESEQLMAQKNEELTRLNVELDRFVYASSHDLTAPLRSILGLIGLAHLTEDREENKKYLAMMKSRVLDLEKFIKEMKDYTRNASSSIMIEEIDIHKLIREVLETLRFYPDADKLEIEVNVQDELIIFSDHTRLKVILSNIISNCFKYCDTEKKNPWVRINAEKEGSTLKFEISDNGLGIPEASLPKVFDMFFRAHEHHGQGSGLGLYIVKETIDKLEGTIAVESNVGDGTTFRITLPENHPN
jgi:signal transduction histidine kinase